jgi:hypothetical protein
MAEEVITLVRIPIREIEQMVRGRHVLPKAMIDVRLESDSLVLYFSDKDKDSVISSTTTSPLLLPRKRKRKARRRRNRTKTHGWEIVARMTNKKGQTCAIYKPFVEALIRPLSADDQRAVVTKILRSNGNRPSETTLNYFLENTLEYLASMQQ